MSGREIILWEVLKHIKLGLDGDALKEKYNLSAEGLKDLYKQLAEAGFLEWTGQGFSVPQKRSIDTQKLVADIRSGVTDLELMEKYKVSSRGLQRVLAKLVDSGLIIADDLSGRSISYDDSATVKNARGSTRALPILSISIHERNNPQMMGKIRDLSASGVGVTRLRAAVGDVKSLVICPDEFFDIEPFSFEAQCRWFRDQRGDKVCSAGFEITDIEEDSFVKLQDLLELMTVSFSGTCS